MRDYGPQETNRVTEGRGVRGWGNWVMGIEEGTCDKHWVLYATNESLNATSKKTQINKKNKEELKKKENTKMFEHLY